MDKWIDYFCSKIYMEMEHYKAEVLKKSPREIYDLSYKTDMLINIADLLADRSEYIPADALGWMIGQPKLLEVLYEKWMQYEDNRMNELESFISDTVKSLCGSRNNAA